MRPSVTFGMTAIPFLLMTLTGLLQAQSAPPRRMRVAVVIVDQLPAPARLSDIAAVRQGVEPDPDVIYLRRDRADAEALLAASFRYMLANQIRWNRGSRSALISVPDRMMPRSWRAGELARATRFLSALKRSPRREIRGLGTVEALDLYLPRYSIARLGRAVQ